MRRTGRAGEHTRGTGCAHGLSGVLLIRARIACDACCCSQIRLVLTSDAMCAGDFGVTVIPCKLSGPARLASALSNCILILSVEAIRACTGTFSRDRTCITVTACICCCRDRCGNFAGSTVCAEGVARRRLVLTSKTTGARAPIRPSETGVASAARLQSALGGGV